MKFDFHTHNILCGHAVGTIEDYILQAIEYNLQFIGISDHSPFFADDSDHSSPLTAMAKSTFPHYVNEVLRLKAKYADRIEVLLGVESDFFPEHLDLYRAEYAKYPFDYIIGSIHRVDGISVFNRERWQKRNEAQKIELKNDYLELISQSASCGLFQIIGHMDAMKSYFPYFSTLPTGKLAKTLETISAHDVAIEINTSYKNKKEKWPRELRTEFADDTDWYPADDILEMACHYGVKVTFGSDAHNPERIADDFDLVRDRLRAIGYREWHIFKAKQAIAIPF